MPSIYGRRAALFCCWFNKLSDFGYEKKNRKRCTSYGPSQFNRHSFIVPLDLYLSSTDSINNIYWRIAIIRFDCISSFLVRWSARCRSRNSLSWLFHQIDIFVCGVYCFRHFGKNKSDCQMRNKSIECRNVYTTMRYYLVKVVEQCFRAVLSLFRPRAPYASHRRDRFSRQNSHINFDE